MIQATISIRRSMSKRLITSLSVTLALAVLAGLRSGQWAAPAAASWLSLYILTLSSRGWRIVQAGMLGLATAVAMGAALQIALLGAGRAQWPFASPNWLGYYVGLHAALALAWRREWPRLANITIAICGCAVMASLSRGSILAFGSGAAVWCLSALPRPRPLALAAGGLSLVLVLLIPHHDEAMRLAIWRVGVQVALQHPWIGWGRGMVWLYGTPGFYNAAIETVIVAGLVGLAAIVWLIAETWRAEPRLRPFLAAFVVNGMVISPRTEDIIPFLVAVAWAASVSRDVADDAARVDNDHPLLDGGVRADRAQRGHRGRDRAVG